MFFSAARAEPSRSGARDSRFRAKWNTRLAAYIHGPIEAAIISLLCKTRITPNQITIGGFIIGCSATAAFALGRVGVGILAALISGIVEGLDGKLARVKIETTKHGKWEHHLDYFIENSWWAAIAFTLWRRRPISERVLFSRFAHRVATTG